MKEKKLRYPSIVLGNMSQFQKRAIPTSNKKDNQSKQEMF